MGKNPLNENAVKTIRRMVQHKPLHSLLLNLSVIFHNYTTQVLTNKIDIKIKKLLIKLNID